MFLTNNLSRALDVSDLIIQFFRKVRPPINTSFFGKIKGFQSCFSKLSVISILKSLHLYLYDYKIYHPMSLLNIEHPLSLFIISFGKGSASSTLK
jgi:hypothetical protein